MLHPANTKVVALSVSAGEALQQGSVLRFTAMPDGSGRLQAFKAASGTAAFSFGTFVAYYITPDSEDVEYKGAPESATFTLNTDTGVGGGINTIASGVEFVALGGSKTALIRMDKYSLSGTPGSLPSPSTVLKYNSSTGLLSAGTFDTDLNCGLVVQNDVSTCVVLLG